MIKTRKLGSTKLVVPTLGFGTVGIAGGMSILSDEEAETTIDAAYGEGIRFFDTAPWYGLGLAEHRLGRALYRRPREELIIATKVGRRLVPGADPPRGHSPWTTPLPFHAVFDYSYDGIMRSVEDSLQRLRLDRVELLMVHDLDRGYHGCPGVFEAHRARLAESGWRALDQLRRTGAVKAIGAAANRAGTIPHVLEICPVDFFLLAMGYTLLHQEVLDDELPLCEERGVGVLAAAVFQSGLLATGLAGAGQYNYRQVPPDVAARVRKLEAVCRAHSVPLAAAALQFPLGHPSVASVIVGALSPAEVIQNTQFMRTSIPPSLWSDLRAAELIDPRAPLPAPD